MCSLIPKNTLIGTRCIRAGHAIDPDTVPDTVEGRLGARRGDAIDPDTVGLGARGDDAIYPDTAGLGARGDDAIDPGIVKVRLRARKGDAPPPNFPNTK